MNVLYLLPTANRGEKLSNLQQADPKETANHILLKCVLLPLDLSIAYFEITVFKIIWLLLLLQVWLASVEGGRVPVHGLWEKRQGSSTFSCWGC